MKTVVEQSRKIAKKYEKKTFGTLDKSRWWFQVCFIFIPNLGKISNLTNIYQRG